MAHTDLAEREGFEPSVGLPLRLISSQVHSTTLPPLRSAESVGFYCPTPKLLIGCVMELLQRLSNFIQAGA